MLPAPTPFRFPGQARRTGDFLSHGRRSGRRSRSSLSRATFPLRPLTEGKISIDEDLATPIFSPYAGRILKLSETRRRRKLGQPLFMVEATDMVQAHNDFITAVDRAEQVQPQLTLAQTVDKRKRDLYEGKAAALKDWQQPAPHRVNGERSRSSEVALEAARNRLRILGKSDPKSPRSRKGVPSILDLDRRAYLRTVVQRKAGPGQYVTGLPANRSSSSATCRASGSSPIVRETEAPTFRSARRSIHACSPTRAGPSPANCRTSRLRSTPSRAGSWCARPSTMPKAFWAGDVRQRQILTGDATASPPFLATR